jgi:hypothetical protein
MADPTEPPATPAGAPQAAQDDPEGGYTRPDRYFMTSDGTLARLEAGWRSQVWRPSKGEWADYPELDLGECTEIPEEEALARAGSSPESGVGEFGGEGEFAGATDPQGSREGEAP